MRRRRTRKPAVSMSLFPFLAVLVCTMGVLIVLLMSLVQQARVDASQSEERPESGPPPQPAEDREELRLQYEDSLWRRDVLETQRSEISAQLADRRLQLSHLEEHIRRLEAKWRELQQQAASLENVGSSRSAEAEAAEKELDRLRAAIANGAARLRGGPRGSGTSPAILLDHPLRRTERYEPAADLHRMHGGRHPPAAGRHHTRSRRFRRSPGARQSTRRRPAYHA